METKDSINMMMELLKDVDQREKQIIVARYWKGMTQKEVAKIMGYTQSWVSRIEIKLLRKLRRGLMKDAS